MDKGKKIALGLVSIASVLAAAFYFLAPIKNLPDPEVVPPGVPIQGTVIDENSKPLPGARVFVYSAGVREGSSPFCPTCYPDCAKSVTTDELGKFVIENVDPTLVFRLLVASPGFKPQFKNKVDPAKGAVEIAIKKRDPADLQLKPILEGRILSPEGKPVAGAVISPFQFVGKEGSFMGPAKEDSIAVSDDQGRFTLVVADGYNAVGIDVEARGLAKRKFLALKLGDEIHDLKMNVGTSVRGRLVKDGKLVAGVNVGICQANRSSESFLGESIVGTNEKGEFLFTNIQGDDTYYLYGKRDSLGKKGVTETKLFAAKGDDSVADVGDVEVLPGQEIEAKIQLSDGKSVPPKTTVLISRPDAWDTLRLQPDESGKIHFNALKGDVLEMAARIPGYVPVFEQKEAWQSSPKFLVDANTKTLTLDFKPKSAVEKITGTALDMNGQPMEGVRLTMVLPDRGFTVLDGALQRGFAEGAVNSDAGGQFSLAKEQGSVGVMALHKKGYAYLPLESWQGTIQLKPWARIHGKAFLGKTAASGKKVTLVTQERRKPGDKGPGYICQSTIAEDGTYQLDYVPEGLQLLGISMEQNNSFGSSWYQQIPAEVKAGESLELALGGKGTVISGKIEMPDDFQGTLDQMKAFGSLRIESIPHQGPPLDEEAARREMVFGQRTYGFTVENDGTFKIEDVLPGNYFLSLDLRSPGGATNPFGEAVANKGVSVTVGKTESLVLDPVHMTLIPKPMKPGDVLPKFELENVRGEKIDNDSLKNKVTLFRFHMARENETDTDDAYFEGLLASLGPQKQLLVISFGTGMGSKELIKKYKDSSLPWQECYWCQDDSPLARAFPIRQYPYYVVVDTEGVVRAGGVSFDEVKKSLAEVFVKGEAAKR